MTCHAGLRAPTPVSHLLFFVAAFAIATPSVAADAVPQRCSKCHTEATLVERVAKMPAQERRTKLEAFLANHFTPDAAERAAIAAALSEKASKKP